MIKLTLQYIDCPVGYYGDNCSEICPTPHYGLKCGKQCDCLSCHHIYGCFSTFSIVGKIISVHRKYVTIRLFLVLYSFYQYFIYIYDIMFTILTKTCLTSKYHSPVVTNLFWCFALYFFGVHCQNKCYNN